jgi:copper transport protein
MRRALLLAAALPAALLLVPAAASAHAVLVDSVPARGATVREQPRQVVLRFSESVEANFGALRVFDARARRVDDGPAQHPGASGARLSVGLKPGLPDGTYVATYRVISADSHPVFGGLVFSVGAPGAAGTPAASDLIGDSSAGPVTQVAFGVARGVTYLATALVLGGLLFVLAVWLPALRSAMGAGQEWAAAAQLFLHRTRRLLLAAAAAGIAAGIAGIVLQGATAGATSGWAALRPAVAGDVLGTRFGEVWGLRVLAFVALIPTQHAEQRGPDASTPPTISTSRWVSGWSMRRRELGGDMRLLAVGREGSSVVGRLTLRAGLQPPSRKPPKRDRAEERSLRA